MNAQQRNLRNRQDPLTPPEDPPLGNRSVSLSNTGEEKLFGSNLHPLLEDPGVVAVQDGPVTASLILKDSQLRLDVLFHRGVPVKVVRSQVEEERAPGMEVNGLLQLEAGELYDPELPRLPQGVREGEADVPGQVGGAAGGGQEVVDQGGHRGLPVGTGDPDDLSGDSRVGELDLRDQRDSLGLELPKGGFGSVRSGGEDDQVAGGEKALRVAPGLVLPSQTFQLFQEPRVPASIGDSHATAFKQDPSCYSPAGTGVPNDSDALSLQIDHHWDSSTSFQS